LHDVLEGELMMLEILPNRISWQTTLDTLGIIYSFVWVPRRFPFQDDKRLEYSYISGD
jgi:hypothetical protein